MTVFEIIYFVHEKCSSFIFLHFYSCKLSGVIREAVLPWEMARCPSGFTVHRLLSCGSILKQRNDNDLLCLYCCTTVKLPTLSGMWEKNGRLNVVNWALRKSMKSPWIWCLQKVWEPCFSSTFGARTVWTQWFACCLDTDEERTGTEPYQMLFRSLHKAHWKYYNSCQRF